MPWRSVVGSLGSLSHPVAPILQARFGHRYGKRPSEPQHDRQNRGSLPIGVVDGHRLTAARLYPPPQVVGPQACMACNMSEKTIEQSGKTLI